MKLKKILLVGLLVLVLAWLFLPGRDSASPVQTAQPTDALTLITPEPARTPAPEPPSTPTPAQTPTPVTPAQTPISVVSAQIPTPADEPDTEEVLDEYGIYTTKEDLALYIHTYGHLPENFIKKKEAEALGWTGGSLDRVLPGMCIGGDYFGNYEGQLPKAKGRRWTECDVDTLGARSRGGKRIIFSNDGLIYYTGDHYESFELLYDGT